LTVGQRRVYHAIREHCFNGPTACPSQQTIADKLGYSREYVNKCVRQLADFDYLLVRKERRPGSRWQHNVYFVPDWAPVHRRRTLKNLRAARRVQAARQSRVHTEGTNPKLRVQTRACVPGRLVVDVSNVGVLPHTSLQCQRLASSSAETHKCRACEALKDTVRTLQEQNNALAEENAGLSHQLRRAGAAEMGLRRKLEKACEDEPDAPDIRRVLNAWKRHHPKAKTPLAGKRAGVVRKALRSHTVEECIEALEGLALLPFVTKGGRRPTGPPECRYDDVEHALRDEQTIARFRSYWSRAKAANLEQRYDAWVMVTRVADRYAELLMEAVHEEDRRKRGDLIDALPEEHELEAQARLELGEAA
jgi:hypothetical protein